MIVGERPIARQRSIWVCVFGQTHIQVSLFSFVDGSEVSRSVLLGVLLIKSLPSKCISQIRLDRSKIKKKIKKKTRSMRVEEDERKKKERKKIQPIQREN